MEIKIERDKEGIWLILDNQEIELTEEEFQQLAEQVESLTKEVTTNAR